MGPDFQERWASGLEFLDLHYHANPDAYLRRLNAVEAGREYQRYGGGVVLRSHLGCTCAVAGVAQDLGFPVFGSVALNSVAGGVAVDVVARSLCHYRPEQAGRVIVDFPTVVTSEHRSKLARRYASGAVEKFGMRPASVCDSGGRLSKAVEGLVELAQSEPVVLSTGHASRRELELLLEICARKGGVRLLLNQPANPITGMTAAELEALSVHDWLYVEQTALTVTLGYQTEEDFFQVLRRVNNVVYSSDFGQPTQPGIEEWWTLTKAWFTRAGLTPERIAEVSLRTPLRLLSP
jgi:hypothetical protein